MNKVLLLVALCFIVCTSCDKEEKDKKDMLWRKFYLDDSLITYYMSGIESAHFIEWYNIKTENGKIEVKELSDNGNGNVTFKILTTPENAYTIEDYQFYEYRSMIGDESYDGACRNIGDIGLLADTITRVDVFCNKDYDDNHKAGESLADIVSIYMEDWLSYIKNGYNTIERDGYYTYDDQHEIPMIYGGVISAMNIEEHPYSPPEYYFSINTLPQNAGNYQFTVTINYKMGGSCSVETPEIEMKARY